MPEYPRWDLTSLFPSLDSPEFHAEFDALLARIAELAGQFDRLGVRRRDDGTVDAAFVATYETVTADWNGLLQRLETVGAYLNCLVSTDAGDELARARRSELETASVPVSQLETRYTAWVGSSDTAALLIASEVALAHEFAVRQAAIYLKHQMSEAEEDLAASLHPVGLSGWAGLHGNISALLAVPVEMPDGVQVLPMSSVRALAGHGDRAVRRAAFEAEIAAWKTVEVPMAAALNGIKGFQGTLAKRRGFEDNIAPTLLGNSIDRATLEAMQTACSESFPDFHRYLKIKARALGLQQLAWYDLTAPLGQAEADWEWKAAQQFITTNFAAYSDRLAGLAERAFTEGWVDVGPRVGKQGGAYCTGVRPGESRVMMNFDGSFTGISTLAHELGHAYHNLNLEKRTPIQQSTPMTLAETASIFCETLAFDATLARVDRDQKIALLENTLERDLMVVVDIHSRFLFEKAVFERRAQRDLSVSEFSELMLASQRAVYGPDLEPLHPYMWAVKGHYYGPTFYNYPYTFGLLFGLGLYSVYLRDPEPFKARYDDLLSRTGMADARSLAAEFGFDVTDAAFWRGSLDIVRGKIAELDELVG